MAAFFLFLTHTKLAADAAKSAYAPYSQFQVGAAILSENGEVFTGCNVENASYGLSMCAERTAVFKAISHGARKLTAIAVASPGGASPCGACRQVLNEFDPDITVYLGNEKGQLIRETSIRQLLPDAFGPENLG